MKSPELVALSHGFFHAIFQVIFQAISPCLFHDFFTGFFTTLFKKGAFLAVFKAANPRRSLRSPDSSPTLVDAQQRAGHLVGWAYRTSRQPDGPPRSSPGSYPFARQPELRRG